MAIRALIIALALLLGGCNSLQFENILKTTATTAVVYATGGVIPAAASMATSMAYDEVVQDQPASTEIEKGNNQQLIGFAIEQLIWGSIAGIALLFGFLLIGRSLGIRVGIKRVIE